MRIAILLLLSFTFQAQAQTANYASEQRANAAVSYYSRARTMLVEALAEYEQGKKYARPDMLHDSEEFRLTLISLTEQLNKLVDPQIRITRDGIRVRANPRLIMRKSQRLPDVVNGPEDGNFYGEERRTKNIQESKARLYNKEQAQLAKKEDMKMAKEQEMAKEQMLKEQMAKESMLKEQMAEKEQMAVKEPNLTENTDQDSNLEQELVQDEVEQKVLEAQEPKEQIGALNAVEQEVQNSDEDMKAEKTDKEDAVTSAIEKTIQERLKSLELDLES